MLRTEKIHGKGSRDRRVSVEIPIIEEIVSVFGSSVWLFEHDGRRYNNNSVTSRIRAAGLMVLGKNVSAHTFRHSWTTEQLRLGRPLNEISKYLGHSSISTTADIYGHLSLPTDKAMLPVFDPSPDV